MPNALLVRCGTSYPVDANYPRLMVSLYTIKCHYCTSAIISTDDSLPAAATGTARLNERAHAAGTMKDSRCVPRDSPVLVVLAGKNDPFNLEIVDRIQAPIRPVNDLWSHLLLQLPR